MKPKQYLVRVRSPMYKELKKIKKEYKQKFNKPCSMDKASSLFCERYKKR